MRWQDLWSHASSADGIACGSMSGLFWLFFMLASAWAYGYLCKKWRKSGLSKKNNI